MTVTRRAILGATAIVPLALAGCAGQTPAQVSAQIVTDLKGALQGVLNAVPAIAKADPTLFSPTQQANVTSVATQGLGVLTAVSASMAATAAAPALAKAEAALNTVLASLAGLPIIPPPYSMILAAAAVVAPMIEGYVSSITGAAAAAPQPAVGMLAARLGSGMTLAEAQAILATQR